MKADKQLWESRAKQILKRNEVQPDENSNADDAADSADGANNNNEPQVQLNDDDRERTWYERRHRQQIAFKYWATYWREARCEHHLLSMIW